MSDATNLVRGHTVATLYEASGVECATDPGLRPVWSGAQIVARAFTVSGRGGDNLALHRGVAAAPAGSVLVVDVQGADNGHWGEVLAVAAQARGIVGLIIDGGLRDTVELEQLGFAAFSRSISVRRTTKEFTGDIGTYANVGGQTFRTGDVVVADADGIIAIPAGSRDEIVSRADERVAKEQTFLDQIRQGHSTMDLYGFAGATA